MNYLQSVSSPRFTLHSTSAAVDSRGPEGQWPVVCRALSIFYAKPGFRKIQSGMTGAAAAGYRFCRARGWLHREGFRLRGPHSSGEKNYDSPTSPRGIMVVLPAANSLCNSPLRSEWEAVISFVAVSPCGSNLWQVSQSNCHKQRRPSFENGLHCCGAAARLVASPVPLLKSRNLNAGRFRD